MSFKLLATGTLVLAVSAIGFIAVCEWLDLEFNLRIGPIGFSRRSIVL